MFLRSTWSSASSASAKLALRNSKMHHMGYPFLTYTSPDHESRAKERFIEQFDTQARLQRESHLVHHGAPKRHGKLKGKRFRHALSRHNVLLSFEGVTPSDWRTEISAAALQTTELLGKRNKAVSDLLADVVAHAKAQYF